MLMSCIQYIFMFYADIKNSNILCLCQRCAESDFFHSYSAPVFQNLTPAPGMTPDYRKIIIYQKHYDEKSLLLRVLFQSKISTSGPAPAPAETTNSCRSRLLYSGSCTPLVYSLICT